MTLILSDSDVAGLVTPLDSVNACEQVFREMAAGSAATTHRRDLIFPEGGHGTKPDQVYRFVTMEGGTTGLGVVAQRIDSEKIAFVRRGRVFKQVEVPVTSSAGFVGLVFLYSMRTGELLAVMNDGEIGRMRVAATVAVGSKYMSREDSSVMGLYGAGWQAVTHVTAIAAVRDLRRVRVYSPTATRRNEFCSEMSRRTGLDVQPVDEPSAAATGADILAAASSSRRPVCRARDIGRGLHLSCVTPYEFGEDVWRRADVIVASQVGHGEYEAVGGTDRFAPTRAARLPYLRFMKKIKPISRLFDAGAAKRRKPDQVTLFYKGLGYGIEFAAIAKVAYDRAVKRGVGREIPTEWFTQSSHT